MTEEKVRKNSKSPKAGRAAKVIFGHENAILGIVLAALVGGMGTLSNGLTLSRTNMVNVLYQSSMRGVGSIGQAFVILSANIDISIGGIGLVSSIIGSSVMAEGWHNIIGNPLGVQLGIFIMLLVGIGWGAINGSSVARIGMPSLIVTLAMWEITKGVAFQISAGHSITQQPEGLKFFGQGVVGGVPVPVCIFIGIAVTAYLVLNHTMFGRAVYAVGGNPASSWLSGINVRAIKLVVFMISGFMAGIAGVIFTSRVMSASMQSLEGLELDSIAAVCVGGVSLMGGKGNIIGVVLGVLIIGIINNGMSVMGAGPALQGIVKGVIIFIAVATDYLRRREELRY